jgi:hypothetical protein
MYKVTNRAFRFPEEPLKAQAGAGSDLEKVHTKSRQHCTNIYSLGRSASAFFTPPDIGQSKTFRM